MAPNPNVDRIVDCKEVLCLPIDLYGIVLPLLGTALGAACVFFLKHSLSGNLTRILNGFAAGVMTAACIWSLLLPALEGSRHLGAFFFLPAVGGLLFGVLILCELDRFLPRLQNRFRRQKNLTCCDSTRLMILAVTLHNIPEGMAVGAAFAGAFSERSTASAAALTLCVGIAIQNFPEGAIVSMPLAAQGMKKGRAFSLGVLSGVVEPIAALLTILAARLVVPMLPFLLSLAAGAMFYVCVEELIPESVDGGKKGVGALSFALGFCVMMTLDAVFG